MKNFRLPNANITGVIILLIIGICIWQGCPSLLKGKETTKQVFDLTNIKLYGVQQMIIAEIEGYATGEFFVDYVMETPFGEFDPFFAGNRSAAFNGELIRIKLGYDSTTNYIAEGATGYYEQNGNRIDFNLESSFVMPIVIDVVPEGFAQMKNSFFKGSVDRKEFHGFVRRRAEQKAIELISRHKDELQVYAQQMILKQCFSVLSPFFPDKKISVTLKFDGKTIIPNQLNDINLGAESINLDTTITDKEIFDGPSGTLEYLFS